MNNILTVTIPFYFNLRSFKMLLSYFHTLISSGEVIYMPLPHLLSFLTSCPLERGGGCGNILKIIWQPSPGNPRSEKPWAKQAGGGKLFKYYHAAASIPSVVSLCPPFIPYAAANHLSWKMYLMYKRSIRTWSVWPSKREKFIYLLYVTIYSWTYSTYYFKFLIGG